MQENDMIIINFLSTANGRMWYKKCGWRLARGVGAAARLQRALQTLSSHCAVFFARCFCSVTGEAKGTRRDGTGRVLFVVVAIAVVGSIVCVVESLFLLCVH
jgi:hypothetical protein